MIAALLLAFSTAADPEPPRIHSISDISQEFSFYMDGRFHTQYLKGVGRDERNWGSLHRLDLSNTNLLILSEGDPHVPYSQESIEHVAQYVQQGGTTLLMIDAGEPAPPGTALAERLGAKLSSTAAQAPLKLVRGTARVEFRTGKTLEPSAEWTPLVVDAKQAIVLAHRRLGEGWVLIGSRGLFGQRPDAKDPINAEWITPLLLELACTKAIDPKRPHKGAFAEHERSIGPLTLEYTDGTARFADSIASEYERVRPELVALTGVEPSPGMIQRLLILPTGGGGFSSGERIAIAAWWGDYPRQRYPMVELISHEAGHSWVLPHPEPLWNEPIATYLGIQVGKRLRYEEAQQTLDQQLRAGRKHDADYRLINPEAADAPRDLVWGKSYFVFEELERMHGPGALAKYFRTKRALLPAKHPNFTMSDCVALWSHACGTDLFPWFRSLAFDVDAQRTALAPR